MAKQHQTKQFNRSNIRPSLYKHCVGCGEPMLGIPEASRRQAHDRCGGKPHCDSKLALADMKRQRRASLTVSNL